MSCDVREATERACEVGKAKEGLENELTYVKQRKGWRMSCDVGKATEASRPCRGSKPGSLRKK